jgi:hypothetical protein
MGRFGKYVILVAAVLALITTIHKGLVLAARGVVGDTLAAPAQSTCGACHSRGASR